MAAMQTDLGAGTNILKPPTSWGPSIHFQSKASLVKSIYEYLHNATIHSMGQDV